MKKHISQIKLPAPSDTDPCPRLMLDGNGIHAGQADGWHDITLEVGGPGTGPACWYISTPGYRDICPVGLFVEI